MNRSEMLNWLIKNLDNWPKLSDATHSALPNGWSWVTWGGVNMASTLICKSGDKRIKESDWNAECNELVTDINDEDINTEAPPSPYHVRNIWKDTEWIDFYRMYDMLKAGKVHEVGDSAIEHAMKKLTALGLRSGGKSKIQDLEEAIWSLQNAIKDIKESE
jgi:hypothetical protein